MKGEIQHKVDWLRYQEFLESLRERSESDTWIHKRVFAKSLYLCRRYKIENYLDEVTESTFEVLSKDRFKKGSSIDSYLTKVITDRAITLRRSNQVGEIMATLPEANKLVVEDAFREITSERNMRRLLISRPELPTTVVKVIVFEMVQNADLKEGNILKTEYAEKLMLDRVKEEIPTVPENAVRTVLDALKDRYEDIFAKTFYSYSGAGTARAKYSNPPYTVIENTDAEEAELLKKIKAASDFKDQERYDELYAKFERGEISSAEHDELLKLSDQREIQEAERLELVSKLAKLRGVSFEDAISEFRSSDNPFHAFQGSTNELRAT